MKGTRFLSMRTTLVVCVLALVLVAEVGFISVASAKGKPVIYPASLTFRGTPDKIRGDESQFYRDGETSSRGLEVEAKIESGGAVPMLRVILGKNEPLPPDFIRETGNRRVFLGLDANLVTDGAFKTALSTKLTQPQDAGQFVAHLSIRIYLDLLQMAVGNSTLVDSLVKFMADGLTQEYVQSLPGGSERTFGLTNDGLHVMFYLDFGPQKFRVTRTSESTWDIATVSGSATVYVQEYKATGKSGKVRLERVNLSNDSLPFGFAIDKLPQGAPRKIQSLSTTWGKIKAK